jgi:hypothetical protein
MGGVEEWQQVAIWRHSEKGEAENRRARIHVANGETTIPT